MFETGFFLQQNNRVTEELNQLVGPSFYLKCISIAEEKGYNSFWFPDHLSLPKNSATLDCWSLLAAAAATTRTIKVGSLVTPVMAQSPFLLAKRAVTVQCISNGRLQLGIGAGWHKEEFTAAGLPFEDHRIRLEQLEETLQYLLHLWESETPVDFTGKYYHASQAILRPRVRRPPLWLGGASDGLLRLVGRYADGWVAFEISQRAIVGKIEQIRNILDASGRKRSDITIGLATRIVAARTSEGALELSQRLEINKDYVATDLPKGMAGHTVVGSFEECTTELASFVDAGVQHLIISPQPSNRTSELLPVYKDEILSKIA